MVAVFLLIVLLYAGCVVVMHDVMLASRLLLNAYIENDGSPFNIRKLLSN